MANNYVSFSIDEETSNKMMDFYREVKTENNSPYIIFSAKNENAQIFIYKSKHGYKATFQGTNSLYEAQIWNKDANYIIPKQKVKTEWFDTENQIGSDEVGTGDFFGPLVVCSAYLSHESYLKILDLHIDDSKKMNDEDILNIVPSLLKFIPYSVLIVEPFKYNELIDNGETMNSIKAILHNQAIQNVKSKIKDHTYKVYLDQFCEPYLFKKYNFRYELVPNIIFETKAESHYPSVAIASMIARYTFLKKWELMEKELGIRISKGASITVDNTAEILKKKIGKDKLKYYVKSNFGNYKRL